MYQLNSWTETPDGSTATSTSPDCASLNDWATGCETLTLHMTVNDPAGSELPVEDANWVTPEGMTANGDRTGNFVPVSETGAGPSDLADEVPFAGQPVTGTLTYVVPNTPGYLAMFSGEWGIGSGTPVTVLGDIGGDLSNEPENVWFAVVNPDLTHPSQYFCNLASTGCKVTP